MWWMARRRALDGIVPQWVAPPPTAEYCSMAATDLPHLAAFMAAPSPPGPVPITIRSKWVFSVMVGGRTPGLSAGPESPRPRGPRPPAGRVGKDTAGGPAAVGGQRHAA